MISVLRLNVLQRTSAESARRTYLLPLLFLVIGLVPSFIFSRPDLAVKNEDSFEYITGSQSILKTGHYLALSGRPQKVFPPGYALAITPFALFSDPIQAAKIVSWLSSGISVLLLFLIASEWFGSRIAAVSALFFALLPIRVWLSQAAQSEPLYVMLILLAVWITVRTRSPRALPAAAVGAILGYAYLTRPEAIILMTIVGLSLLVMFVRTRTDKKPLLAFITAVLLVVVPYVLWLSFQAGHFVLTGKGRGEIGRGIARLEGKPDVLMRRLSDDDSDIVIATTTPSLKETVVHTARNLQLLKDLVLANTGMQPFAGALILLGFLEAIRRMFLGKLWSAAILQLFFVLHLILYSPFWIEERLMYASSPALCIWMAVGAATIFKLMKGESGDSLRWRAFSLATAGVLIAMVSASNVLKLHSTNITDEKTAASKQMAQSIAERADLRNEGVIGEYPAISFFAGTRHEWIPYCDLNQLRRFARKNNASLVVVSEHETPTPATQRLLAGNYSSSEAQLITKTQFGNQDLQVFRLSPIADK